MKSIKDCFTLNNGLEIPCLGFGTYRGKSDDDGKDRIVEAIKAGYRYFDTASLYGTEEVLGQAIIESGIPREEFFIITKMWTDELGYENTKIACKESLERMQMDYVDVYMIHWPKPTEECEDWKALDKATWKAMEELVDEGKAKGIGLSNFLPHHIENILEDCRIKPVVNQLEIHLGYSQEAAVAYCKAHDIQVQAWSPLGRSAVLNDPYLMKIADKYQVSVARLGLRFLLQKDIISLAKASSMERMIENQDVFSFEISQEDMWALETMPQNLWQGEHPDVKIPKKPRRMD